MSTTTAELSRRAAARLGRGAAVALERLHPLGDATAGLETISWLDSFLPSLMPRTTEHQGLASGVHVLGARVLGGRVNALHVAALGADAALSRSLLGRAATLAVGYGASRIPEEDDETLWRSGARTGGRVVMATAVSGALHDLSKSVRARTPHSQRRAWLTGGAMLGGVVYWAGRRMRYRQSVIPRWPVEQRADVPRSIAIAMAVSTAGSVLGAGYHLTRRGFELYLGGRPGGRALARLANAGMWTAGAVAAYNAAISSIGRGNEKIEPAYAAPPTSPLLSGSPESVSEFADLGQQGRRFVTDVVTPEMIEEVTGEPAIAHPIRAYVGFNSLPLYGSGRAELALEELERTGAFDRSYLLLVSPTGTGWVDQAVVEAAEFLTRGDIATCSVQYGRFPSFLAVQKVGLGRIQFRLLLWGVRQRLRMMPEDERPKVLVFGESLGAWTASDVVMAQGIGGFDHYGIDKALWVGLPALAKWSRNGMAAGSSDLVPEGTVGVFDRHEQLAALSPEELARLRAVILSHDNDPIASLRPELMIREPDWLRGERGRNVPEGMDWIPVNTFWQVMTDAANAMVTVPGEFGSFGHDYRGDTTRFVRDAYDLPLKGEEVAVAIDDALRTLDVERKQRLAMSWDDDADALRESSRFASKGFSGGVPLEVQRARGPRWFER